jgi:RND family efflux transporter MFP subunit
MFRKLFQVNILLSMLVILALGFGGYFFFGPKDANYQFVAVTRGPITEVVSVTGNTTPIASVSLGFENSGTIGYVYAAVGDKVSAGRLLAALNTNDLSAQLKQAQADVNVQIAKLDGLKAGARAEDIAASQAALAKAEQDLANMNASISDIAIDAEAKANDAVRTQLSALFSNAETQSPKLTFDTLNTQKTTALESERVAASAALNSWQDELRDPDLSGAHNDALLEQSLRYLAVIRDLLNSVSSAVDGAANLSPTTLAAYKTSVATALNQVNTVTKNLNTIAQTIASQKLIVAQLAAQLALKKAGGAPEEINAQQAQVEKARANVASVEAKLANSKIIAPITGTITEFNAKVGQLASPSVPLVSLIGSSGFEVDAGVSEADIGKIALNNAVTMTIDAFPNETFLGTVFYIAPAETTMQGVVNYEVKVAFDKPDARLKSGLTANLTIATKHKDEVLILPQYALLQNDEGTFVQVLEGEVVKQIPVTLGITDQSGNVEITSGVSLGEQVMIIGLKKQ